MLIVSISRCILKILWVTKEFVYHIFGYPLPGLCPSGCHPLLCRLLKNLDTTPNETAREQGASELVNRHINMAQRPLETEGVGAEALVQLRWGNEHRNSAERSRGS